MNYNEWETYNLREECINRQLSIEGNKFALVQRLVNDDVERRISNLDNFNSINDPDGSKERQYIQEEIGFKQWAHVTLSDAGIAYHTRQIGKITAEKRSGVEALSVEKKEALLSVDNRVNGVPPKHAGEDDAMDVDSVPMPKKTGTARKRSLSSSEPHQVAKKGKWQSEVEGESMAFGLPRVKRSFKTD